MTINSKQIHALAARLQLKANEAKQSDDWGCDSNNFHDVATPDNILSLLAERDADKALIAEQDARLIEYARIATENAARTLTVKLPPVSFFDFKLCSRFASGAYVNVEAMNKALAAAGITLVVGE